MTQASLAYVDKDLWLLSCPLSRPGSNEGHSAFPVAFQCLMVISEPTWHLCWKELGTAGWVSLPGVRLVPSPSPSSGGPLRPDPGTAQVCLFSCVLAVPPCPGECAQLASLGTRLSRSSLIYYKGDGDKGPREPLRIQCPCRSNQSRPRCGRVAGSWRWNFCRVCFICVVSGGGFLQLPHLLARTQSPDEAPEVPCGM